MEMFGIAENVRIFLEGSIEHWNLSLTSNGEVLEEVDVMRDISRLQSFATFVCVEYDTSVIDS